MVCQGFKAPDQIDPRLLDPKFALEQVEEENVNSEKITSLKKLITTKKNRGGYDDKSGSQLYAECDLMEFLQAQNPHMYLSGFNKFKLNEESKSAIAHLKAPRDLEIICSDLKTCGRKEFSDLLKLRLNYVNAIESKNRTENEKKKAEIAAAKGPKSEAELQAEVDKELQETIDRMEKQKKRQAKKMREIEQKQDTKKKMSVIASTTINNDEDLILDKKTWAKLKTIDADDLDKYIDYSSDSQNSELNYDASLPGMSSNLKELKAKDDAEQRKLKGQLPAQISDDSEDDVMRIDRMEEEINEGLESKKEFAMIRNKKEIKKDIKTKALVDLQRQKRTDLDNDEQLENKEIFENKAKPGDDSYSENDDDLEEERMIMKL